MEKKRITEIFPFLLPFRKWQKKLFFYINMYFDSNKYSKEKFTEELEYQIYKTDSQMINKNSGFDIKYQMNKVDNLKLASKNIDHLLIRPNETFSFWKIARDADKDKPYKEGLNLVNRKIVGSYGGGLCQLSNMLFWMFLHTPLTIIERHSHNVQNFAPINDKLPVGVDATISEGWKDLKIRNETQNTYQIIISFDEKYMYGQIRSDSKPIIDYKIFNEEVKYYEENNNMIQIASVNRREVNKDTKRCKEILLYKNVTQINYQLDKKTNYLKERENMEKKTIGILFGGCSSEYFISIESAYGVLSNIDREKYNIVPIGITKEGEWYHYFGDIKNILGDTWGEDRENLIPAIISPDRRKNGLIEFRKEGNKISKLDGVLPVLHGKNGEDGSVQGLIQLAGIPIIGCNTLSSALSMDKGRAHKIVKAAGVEVTKSITINSYVDEKDIYNLVDKLEYPLFVKPVNEGSSYGITKVHVKNDLLDAIRFAFKYDSEVIIEENVEGFEVGCAILGNKELIVGRVDEIELLNDFFDYDDKYTSRKSIIHMPGRIDRSTEKKIKEVAKTIYRALACSGFARVDMFLTPDNRVVFNEVNTIPGLTAKSRYPSMMEGIGLSYKEVLDKLVELGVGK